MPNMTPNKSVMDVLLWLTGKNAAEFADELSRSKGIDSRTIEKALGCKGPVKDEKLKAVAEHFSAKLTGAAEHFGVPPALTADDLCKPPPALQRLADRFAEARRAAPCPRGAAPGHGARACAVHESQQSAFKALEQHLRERNISLTDRTVTITAFTAHKLGDAVEQFIRVKPARAVVLYLGTERTTDQLKSDRQRELMSTQLATLEGEYPGVLKSERLQVVRYGAPPTFQGYLIPGVAVCVGPYAWFPPPSRELEGKSSALRSWMNEGSASQKDRNDPFHLNGHLMPHFQVFWEEHGENAEFRVLQEAFELYTDTHREHAERTGSPRPTC